MILSDGDILDRLEAGDLVIEPLEDLELQVQPASVDVRLGREFLEFQRTNIPSIHPNSENQVGDYVSETVVEAEEEFILHPGDFVLGTTRERVEIPGDLVAQVEGRSSLGRLAIVVHASLPADETLFLWTPEEGFGFYDIGQVVEEERAARAVSFDPETLGVRTFEITDFITNPKQRIFRLELDSGRVVHVTEDHNVFTLDEHGTVSRIRTGDAEDELVMVPGQLPDPRGIERRLDLTTLLSDAAEDIVVSATDGIGALDRSDTDATTRNHHQAKNVAPLNRVSYSAIPEDARVGFEGSNQSVPRSLPITETFGWVLGFYIAEGDVRRKQLVFTTDEEGLLERVAAYFDRFDTCLSWQRGEDVSSQLTVCSELWASVFSHLVGAGRDKTIPERAWNWDTGVLEEFYDGLLDGDGRRREGRDTLYTGNETLADRAQYLGSRLDRPTAAYSRGGVSDRSVPGTEWRVDFYDSAHQRGTFVPNPSALLQEYRKEAGLTRADAASEMGYASRSSISNVENRDYETVTRETLRRFRDCYRAHGVQTERVDAILAGSIRFDRVERVVDTGRVETTYDLEVRPAGRPIENFLGGFGGIFLSNTAGFIDPGFRGRITLELSNLGTAPVALSPGMRISQLVFTELKTPARKPYGTERGSKYQDQSGPAASRIQNDEEFGGEQG